MTDISNDPDKMVVAFDGVRCPANFEVCWAGEFEVPSPHLQLFCLGSTDGKLAFADRGLKRVEVLGGKGASASGEAINGVARAGGWVAVSTVQEINFYPATTPEAGGYSRFGAHGVRSTSSGYFIAPMGRQGVLTARPPFDGEGALTAHVSDRYIYRVISLVAPSSGREVLVCAARLDGIVAGEFSPSLASQSMRATVFKDIDIVDVSPLSFPDPSLAVAALGRDGSLILFHDILADKKPKTVKF